MANVERDPRLQSSDKHFKNALFATAESIGVVLGSGVFPPAILLLFVTGPIAVGEAILGISERAKYALRSRQASQ
jgi:hypothetical protein